jgi:hypothetical protein
MSYVARTMTKDQNILGKLVPTKAQRTLNKTECGGAEVEMDHHKNLVRPILKSDFRD